MAREWHDLSAPAVAFPGSVGGGLAWQYPHLDIWGGCCGTWETHLDEIARNVREARGLVE